MSPMHPKLRKALLQDPVHRERGLTARRLSDYEGLLSRLFYLVYYGAEGKEQPQGEGAGERKTPEDLIREIKTFQDQFMPNYEAIHRQWARNQKRAVTRRWMDIHPRPGQVTEWFRLYFAWLRKRLLLPVKGRHAQD